MRATKVARLDDYIVQHYLRFPAGVRIRTFSLPQSFGQGASTDAIDTSMKARKAMNQLENLGCDYIMSDMVNGSYAQSLIGAYAAFQSVERFTISIARQYQPSNGLTELGVYAQSTIPAGPIENLLGIRVLQTVEEAQIFELPEHRLSNGISERNGRPYVIAGPARFLNHDCDSNADLVPYDCYGLRVIAKREIRSGEEITISYGKEYFRDTCQCKLCKGDRQQGLVAL